MFAPQELSRHPVDVGQRSEAIVIARLVAAGHPVLLPWGPNQRYDIVVEVDDRFLKVQIKTARIRNGAIVFAPYSVRVNTRAVLPRGYKGDVDLFMAYCPHTGRIYAIPPEEVGDRLATFRIDPPANNQAKGIHWAADYELPV